MKNYFNTTVGRAVLRPLPVRGMKSRLKLCQEGLAGMYVSKCITREGI